jgi:hypothetical protein
MWQTKVVPPRRATQNAILDDGLDEALNATPCPAPFKPGCSQTAAQNWLSGRRVPGQGLTASELRVCSDPVTNRATIVSLPNYPHSNQETEQNSNKNETSDNFNRWLAIFYL